MKSIRNITILLGLFLALLALAATRANAQAISTASFRGTFTLPFEAQWGGMTLPAGEYTLSYGLLDAGRTYMVEVMGKEGTSRHGLIRPGPANQVRTSENALICIRDGNRIFVRELRMAEIGGSISFALPRGVKLMANQRSHNGNTQIAQGPMLIQRVPLKPIGKQ